MTCLNKSVKNFNRQIRAYKIMCKYDKFIICWHKQINCFTFFVFKNLEHIKNNENIEVIWIPENESLSE